MRCFNLEGLRSSLNLPLSPSPSFPPVSFNLFLLSFPQPLHHIFYSLSFPSILEALTNLTIPYVVVTGDGEESIVTLFAQDPQTNLLVSFDELERLLFDNYLTIQEAVPLCTLLSIKVCEHIRVHLCVYMQVSEFKDV